MEQEVSYRNGGEVLIEKLSGDFLFQGGWRFLGLCLGLQIPVICPDSYRERLQIPNSGREFASKASLKTASLWSKSEDLNQ